MSVTIGEGEEEITVTTSEGVVPLAIEQGRESSKNTTTIEVIVKVKGDEAQVVDSEKQEKTEADVGHALNGRDIKIDDTSDHQLQCQDNYDEAEVVAIQSESNEALSISEAKKAKKRIYSKTCRSGNCSCKHCLEAKRSKQEPPQAEMQVDDGKAKRKAMPTNKFKKLAISFTPTVDKIKCPECILVFDFEADMKVHFDAAHTNQPKLCSICRDPYQNEELLKLHEMSHEKSGSFMCLKCDKSYRRKADIVRHCKVHLKEKASLPVKRKSTEETAPEDNAAKRKAVADDGQVKQIAVPEGNQVKQKPASVPTQASAPTPPTPPTTKSKKLSISFTGAAEKVKCTVCAQEFATQKDMQEHFHSTHSEKPMLCSICQEAFKSEGSLKQHEASHQKDGRFLCMLCDRTYKRRTDIVNHYNGHRDRRAGGSRSQQPGQKATTGSSIGDSSVKEEMFTCHQCGKEFVQEQLLEVHKRVHTGDLPYPCTMCDKSFKQLNQLKKHERVHTGEKPFMCEYCNKRFYSSSNKRRHERTHTGFKPYVCEVCDKPLSEKWILKKHMKTHLSIGGISFDD